MGGNAMIDSKTCSKCRVHKPAESFHKASVPWHGLQSQCKDCHNARDRQPRTSEFYRKHDLKRKYKMTVEDYTELFLSQNGLCAICNQPETTVNTATGEPLNLAVDHCHTTNTVRGLLCTQCNTGLGRFKDNPDRLRAAAKYLESVEPTNATNNDTWVVVP